MTRENNKEVIWLCKNHSSDEGDWVWDDQNDYGICPDPDCNKKMTPYIIKSQYEALESKLALAIEALEDIANVDRDYPEQQIARKALTKLKEE